MVQLKKDFTHFRFNDICFTFVRHGGNIPYLSKFTYCSIKDASSLDMIILGSDEIWNVRRESIYKNKILFGYGLKNIVVSYAPSVNNAEIVDFLNMQELVTELQKLKYISVRDERSNKIISTLLGRKVVTVVDPTLLLEKNKWEHFEKKIFLPARFMMLYLYAVEDYSLDFIGQLQDYAYENEITMVSSFAKINWANKNIGMTPFQFLYAAHHANVVVTDTFHGVMFALIYQKNLIIPKVASCKLQNIITQYQLEDRVFSDVRKVKDILHQAPNYKRIKSIMDNNIKNSKQYLSYCIHEAADSMR